MLKHTSNEEIEAFIKFVQFFFNPKIADENEWKMTRMVLYEFAKSCSLTLAEMKEALQMASKGFLVSENEGKYEKIKLFREIDRLKLDEVEQAYIAYRDADYNHQKGKEMLNNLLKPPTKELPISKEAERQKKEDFLKQFAQAYKETGTLPMGSVQSFYKWLFFEKRLPEQTPQYIEQMTKRGKQRLRKELATLRNASQKQEIKHALEGKENQLWRIKAAVREEIMEDFFKEYNL